MFILFIGVVINICLFLLVDVIIELSLFFVI